MAGDDRGRRGWALGPHHEVVLSATRRQVIVMSVLVASGPLVGGLIASIGRSIAHPRWGEVATQVVSSIVFALVFAPIVYLFHREDRCVLTPTGISSAHAFGSSAVGWGDVVAIDERRVLGGRQVRVVTRYRSKTLRGVWTGPGRLFADPDFDAKLATIQAWQRSCTPAAAPPSVYPPPLLPWLPPPPA